VVAGDGDVPGAALMAEEPRLTKDYTNAPVPDEATIHGLRIAMVVAGIGATLPVFLLGSQISVGQGLRLAVPVCFAACALVGLLGTLTSIVGSRSRLSTYQVVTFAFGVRGARLVNLVLGVMLIGWFATTGEMLGTAIQHAVAGIHGSAWPQWTYTVGSLTAMTLTGIFGFRMMERFVRVTVPLLAALMGYVVWLSLMRGGLTAALSRHGDESLSTVDALSSVIGAIILTAVLAPDLTRYARNDRHALLSVLGLVVGFPAALIMAAIPAAVFGEGDVMKVMTTLNIPGIAIVILVMSTWTSNTSNLYSSTLTLATFFKRSSGKQLGCGAALVALVGHIIAILSRAYPRWTRSSLRHSHTSSSAAALCAVSLRVNHDRGSSDAGRAVYERLHLRHHRVHRSGAGQQRLFFDGRRCRHARWLIDIPHREFAQSTGRSPLENRSDSNGLARDQSGHSPVAAS
jgi:cytosine permease